MKRLKELGDIVATAFYPARCPFCDRVILRTENACAGCAARLPEINYARFAWGGYRCSAPLPYEGVYANAVRRLKFSDRSDYAKPLAAQVARAIPEIHRGVRFDLVTWVPMHPADLRKRSYNQAELLARECAALLELPCCDTLEKAKRNQPQHMTKGRDREMNVHGVFRLKNPEAVRGKNVLIVDDIITTGYTLGECARILHKGKCAEIGCAVVCTVAEYHFVD